MTASKRTRGVLDASTVILLPRLSDPTPLPAEPLITAVFLAELSMAHWSPAAIKSGRPVRRISSRPKPSLMRSHLTRLPQEHSGKLPHRFGEAAGRAQRAPTTL
jgi:hypothetical protein